MPDLMQGEFQQIHEAIDAAYEMLNELLPNALPMGKGLEYGKKMAKVKTARELMVDLAGGNSR